MDVSTIPQLDWAVYIDEDSGGEYFYNRVSKETQWEAPAEYLDWVVAVTTTYLKSTESPWRISKSDTKVYYYNKQTKKSSWTRPLELDEIYTFLVSLTQQRRDEYDADECLDEMGAGNNDEAAHSLRGNDIASDDVNVWPSDTFGRDGTEENNNTASTELMFQHSGNYEQISLSNEQKEDATKEVDVAVLISELESKLDKSDAIMEVDIFQTIEKYLRLSNERPETVVSKLKQGYRGHAKMTRLLLEWCSLGGADGKSSAIDSNRKQEETSFSAKMVMYDLLSKLIKKKFDRSLADSLIRADTEVPSWLTTMMSDEMWRKLLIELLDSNRGSVLLGYCLRQISAMGHHR